MTKIHSIDPSSFSHEPVQVAVGHLYLNRSKKEIRITAALGRDDYRYPRGFRFCDTSGMAYTQTGVAFGEGEGPGDLIVEVPGDVLETVETVVTAVTEPGFFGRMYDRVRQHPWRSAAIIGAVGGAGGYGGYNYYNYGSVLPNGMNGNDVADVVNGVSNLIGNR